MKNPQNKAQKRKNSVEFFLFRNIPDSIKLRPVPERYLRRAPGGARFFYRKDSLRRSPK